MDIREGGEGREPRPVNKFIKSLDLYVIFMIIKVVGCLTGIIHVRLMLTMTD